MRTVLKIIRIHLRIQTAPFSYRSSMNVCSVFGIAGIHARSMFWRESFLTSDRLHALALYRPANSL